MSESKCWFYRAKISENDYFKGAFRPQLLWLDNETTILVFYTSQGIPRTVRFSCPTQTFLSPQDLDFSALGVEVFDFFIQKAFIFQGRLLLVKNCLSGEKAPLLISDQAIARLYPIKLEIEFDMLHSAIAFDGANLYVFGGFSLETSKPSNALYKLDLCSLRISKVVYNSQGAPAPRSSALIQVVGEELFVFGGSLDGPKSTSLVQTDFISAFNFKKKTWEDFSMGNLKGLEIKGVCHDREKILVFAKGPEPCCYLFKPGKRVGFRAVFANRVQLPFGVS